MLDDIFSASWANIWAAITAISTASAVFVAAWAMLRWRKQDELKVKLAFKQAVCNYAYCLYQMPEMLSYPTIDLQEKAKKEELERHLESCSYAWFSMEGLLDNDEKIKNAWQTINDEHPRYLRGEIDLTNIASESARIMTAKFIFK